MKQTRGITIAPMKADTLAAKYFEIYNSRINTREGRSHTLGDYLDYGHRVRIPVWRKHY